jgi:hypothetical protein
MQNIVELAGGACELFNKTLHLDPNNLSKHRDEYLFVRNNETKAKEDKENQIRLEAILKGYKERNKTKPMGPYFN